MLPQHRHKYEYRGDKDYGEGNLRNGPAGEGLHLTLGTFAIFLLMPTREGSEEDEANEGEDNGNDAVRA